MKIPVIINKNTIDAIIEIVETWADPFIVRFD